MLSKIMQDPFYSKLYEKYGREYIEEAGYFNNTAHADYPIEVELDCTPISFLLKRLSTATNPALLLSTGAFCPLHDGHVEMAFKAKEEIENNGYNVIGGYFAPDNDEYVLTKQNVLNIHERMKLMNNEIKDIDWLAIDPWSGIFRKHAENFTIIYKRLELYIEKKLGIKIPIFFVCGGDNARFSLTFKDEGYCVIVERPGGQGLEYYSKLKDSGRILYAFNDNANSSTEVRKKFGTDKTRKSLLLRMDASDKRERAIYNELTKRFDVQVTPMWKQIETFNEINVPIISIDSILYKEHQFQISRQYDFFGSKFLNWVNRPGTLPLNEQLEALPKQSYFLFDDDIHTGKTIQYVKSLLTAVGIKIIGNISLSASNETEEVLDLRDFYIGKENCGLVILDEKGNSNRYPYIYPFVCPYERASIKDPMEFSIRIWEINRDYFKLIGDHELIEYCDKYIELLTNR